MYATPFMAWGGVAHYKERENVIAEYYGEGSGNTFWLPWNGHDTHKLTIFAFSCLSFLKDGSNKHLGTYGAVASGIHPRPGEFMIVEDY